MGPRQRILRDVLLFILGIAGGGALGAILTLALYPPETLGHVPISLFGFALTYAGFGALPTLFFGLPALSFLRRRSYSRPTATLALAIGGGVVGGLLMFATFGMFKTFGWLEQFGAIGGASIGFVLGLLFFSGRVSRV